MPSAASVKVEKQSTTNNLANNVVAAINTVAPGENVDNNSPIRQISLIIEHKIRNLEKRKSKLESYRDLEKTGKDLSADKKVAILKYDEVAMTLEFAREFSKQIEKVIVTSEKDLKKKQKKDETLKKQNETSKIRETLLMHDMLRQLRDDIVRKDFLAGTNGACKLDEEDLVLLDAFAAKAIPNRSSLNGVTFKNVCQKAADHLVQTIDGKQKEFETSTYANVKILLKNIQKSNYFDKADQPSTDNIDENADENGENGEIDNNVDEHTVNQTNTTANTEPNTTNSSDGQQPLANVHTENHEVFTEQTNKIEAPSASAVPVPTFAPSQNQQPISQQQPQPQQSHGIPAPNMNVTKNMKTIAQASPVPMAAGTIPLAQVPPAGHPIPAGAVQPTTVRAVEQAYFKQHQFIQQMRPLAEVLGGGHFHFLQDSELDSPDVPNNNNNAPHPADRQQIGQPPSQKPPQPQAQQPQQITTVDSNQFFPMIHNPQNNSFPNVVAPNHQPNHQMQQQPHIPGFASNAAIPIPIPTAAQIPVVQSVQQQATSANSSAISNPLLAQKQPQPFSTATKFVNPTNISENSSHDLNSNSNSNDLNEHGNDLKNFTSNRTVGIQSNGNNAWHDPYNTNKGTPESNEWNGVPNENGQQDESNTWSSGNSNQRYNQYRQGSGNYRSTNNKSTFSKNPPNGGGYRGSGNYRSSSNKQTTFSKNNSGNNNNNGSNSNSNSNSTNNNGNSNNGYRGSSSNNYRPSTNKTTFTKTTTNGYRG